MTRDGLIVFGVLSDNLFILDPKGKLKASTNPGSWVFSTPVIGPGNQIYVSCDDGRVHCMDATGKILWTYRLSAESSSTPALCNGHLYLGAEDDGLHCLTDTGKHRWKYNTRGRILFSSPGLDSQGNIYIGDENNILHAVNPDGTPRWQFEAGSEISTTSPIITDNGVIIPAGPDITALDVQGKILWQKTLHEEVTGNPCLSPQGDLMAVPVLDGVLVIMDVKDGKVTAKAKVAGNLQASAVADSQGRIYIVGDKGPIVAGWDGRILHKALLEKGGPFRGDPVITPKGQLIFGGMDGILYCFE